MFWERNRGLTESSRPRKVKKRSVSLLFLLLFPGSAHSIKALLDWEMPKKSMISEIFWKKIQLRA